MLGAGTPEVDARVVAEPRTVRLVCERGRHPGGDRWTSRARGVPAGRSRGLHCRRGERAGRRSCARLVGGQCAACEGDGGRSPRGGSRRSWDRLPLDVELQAHRQRRDARYHRRNVPRSRLRAADDLHARRAHGGLAMATDPIVDEIHAIREEIARVHD